MEIIKIKIDDLKPYKNNAKLHPEWQIEQIIKSIEQFGFNDPIAVWGEDNIIVEGHGRLEAVKKLGYTEVECIRLDHLTEEERKAYTLAHNKTTMNSDFDFDFLKLELDDIKGINMSDFGFELDLDEDDEEVVEDDFEIEVPEEPKAKLGDIYQLGNHRLMCGDSVSSDVEVLMNGEQADLVVTDPPYNVAVNDESEESLIARNRRVDGLKVQNDNMSDGDFKIFLEKVFIKYNNLLKEGCPIYVFYTDSETINFMSSFADAGFHFAQNCIWNKQQFVMTRKDYHYKHEPILYGWKKGAAHPWHTDRKQSSVWDFDRPFRSELHPTTKPLDLIAYPINNSSKKKELVVDLFGGSGSTLIACEQLNRKCYMMELDPRYIDVIIDRWETFTGNKAILKYKGGAESGRNTKEK